jgi:hypothetical protein
MLNRDLAGQASILPGFACCGAILHSDGLRLLARDLAILDALDAVGPRLLALSAHLDSLRTLRPRLLALCAHLDSLGALRTRLLALGTHLLPVHPLLAFGPGLLGARLPERLELGTRLRGARVSALRLRSLSILAIVATRTRRGRH